MCVVAAMVLLASGCEGEGAPADEQSLPAAADTLDAATPTARLPEMNLVDPAIAAGVAGEEGWMYSQSVETDLDSDGDSELVVLAARAEMFRGRPAWDDGQPWQVYVEEPGGERTHLYRRYVQLGTVTMRIGLAEEGRRASIILLEHLPDRLAVYELEYRGPGQVSGDEAFVRSLDPTGDISSPVLP